MVKGTPRAPAHTFNTVVLARDVLVRPLRGGFGFRVHRAGGVGGASAVVLGGAVGLAVVSDLEGTDVLCERKR